MTTRRSGKIAYDTVGTQGFYEILFSEALHAEKERGYRIRAVGTQSPEIRSYSSRSSARRRAAESTRRRLKGMGNCREYDRACGRCAGSVPADELACPECGTAMPPAPPPWDEAAWPRIHRMHRRNDLSPVSKDAGRNPGAAGAG